MSDSIELVLLVNRPSQIPAVARWWCEAWGFPERHASFADYVRELETLAPEALPVHVLAEQNGSPVGVATLKAKDGHSVALGRSFWLSGVYVDPAWRRKGIAKALCQDVIVRAGMRRIDQLYLQTEHLDGGLYARLGWTPVRRHHEGGVEQLIMVKDL
jgi:GNAT superfamily N-acetyltransferase